MYKLYSVVIQSIQIVEAKDADEAKEKALNDTKKEDLRAVDWVII